MGSPQCEQTDTIENMTIPKLCWWAVMTEFNQPTSRIKNQMYFYLHIWKFSCSYIAKTLLYLVPKVNTNDSEIYTTFSMHTLKCKLGFFLYVILLSTNCFASNNSCN